MTFNENIDALLTALADSSSDEVEKQLQFFNVNDIVAVMAKRLLDAEEDGGGGSDPSIGFIGIYNTGPNSGLDDTILLAGVDDAITQLPPGGSNTVNSFFGPITIGAGGGFAVIIELPKAFVVARPSMGIVLELAVSNAAGTEKLAIHTNYGGIPFDTSGTVAKPDYTTPGFGTVEAIGSDLSRSPIGGYPLSIVSAAGGQYFASLFTQVQGMA